MKMAEYMFKELGYNLIRKDDDYIIYKKQLDNGCVKTVIFCDQLKDVNVSYGEFVNQTPSINMQLFRAIEKQLKELVWIP